MAAGVEKLVAGLLARQGPDAPHRLLTRFLVSAIIVFAQLVLYGFYGVIGAVGMYLLGVELGGLSLRWMYLPIGVALVFALWGAAKMLIDYWRNYGH
ncbi:MAG: hypothetical protein AAFQ62_04950 [Pseudomonadota bacterium]